MNETKRALVRAFLRKQPTSLLIKYINDGEVYFRALIQLPNVESVTPHMTVQLLAEEIDRRIPIPVPVPES